MAAVMSAAVFLGGCAGGEKQGIDMTLPELAEEFNLAAADTDYALGKSGENNDGTYSLATKDETARVICVTDGDEIKEIDVNGTGYYSPGLPSFDYMMYVLMAVDKSFDETSAGDFIANLYYEASNGGDEVFTSYNGLAYTYQKQENDYWLKIKAIDNN